MVNQSIYRIFFLITYSLLCIASVYAQGPVDDLLKKIRKANSNHIVAYEYKILLKNTKTNKAEDSIQGKMYKYYDTYLDSNEFTLTTVDKSYYCKLEFETKTAIVFSIEDFKEKLGVTNNELKPAIIDLSDSIIAKYGKSDVSKLPDGDYKIKITFPNYNFQGFTAVLDKNEMFIKSVEFVVIDKDRFGEATGYSKYYLMDNFKYSFDKKVLNRDRFFVNKENKIILTKKYSAYHLNTLTD